MEKTLQYHIFIGTDYLKESHLGKSQNDNSHLGCIDMYWLFRVFNNEPNTLVSDAKDVVTN